MTVVPEPTPPMPSAAPLPVTMDRVTAAGDQGLVVGAAALTLGAASRGVAALDRALGGLGTVPRALDGVIGAGAAAGSIGLSGLRSLARRATPIAEVLAHPPLVPERLQPGVRWQQWADRGWRIRRDAEWEVEQLVDIAVPMVVEQVLNRIDLTGIVLDKVDIDAILQAVDLPRVAEYVVDEIDLAAIIRESTSSVTAEAVRDVRMQSVDADQTVARLVDRLVHRRSRRTDADSSEFDEPESGAPREQPAQSQPEQPA